MKSIRYRQDNLSGRPSYRGYIGKEYVGKITHCYHNGKMRWHWESADGNSDYVGAKSTASNWLRRKFVEDLENEDAN